MRKHSSSFGFTLVELLVSVGLFTMMTSVVLAKYRTFENNAKFTNAAEDIVLAFRQAQVYGVATKAEASSFDIPYGVYLKQSTPSQIIIFADRDRNGRYTNTDNPVIGTINWGSVFSSLSLKCAGGVCSGNEFSVTFERPNVDAIIKDGSGSQYTNTNASVTVSNGTKTSIISISDAGQISVQ